MKEGPTYESQYQLNTNTDDDKACLNTELNWTCPGEYLKVHSAIWKTVANCGRTFINLEDHNVVMRMQNKCSNKTPCVFTVEHSSFGVSCSETSSNLDYFYTCVIIHADNDAATTA